MVDHEPPEYPAESLEWEEQLRAAEPDNPDGFWFDWADVEADG